MGPPRNFASIQNIGRKVTEAQKAFMMAPVTDAEVNVALFYIHSQKAPGPDGYNAAFFKDNWDIVGPLLTVAVKSFFITGKLLRAWNATTLALIPKVAVPSYEGLPTYFMLQCYQ